MSANILRTDFNFIRIGYGNYKITYKSSSIESNNYSLIDDTKNCEFPTQSNLLKLRDLFIQKAKK